MSLFSCQSNTRPQPTDRSFTMLELVVTIAIIEALVVISLFTFVSVANWAQQTMNNHVLTNLNMALTDYQTLGGMSRSHSLQGTNSSTEVAAVLTALQTGFTVGGQLRTFLAPNTNIDPTHLYAAGQAGNFHFSGYGTGPGMYGTGGDGIEGQIMATLAADGINPVSGLGTWIGTAQAAAGGTNNYLLLTQPSSSTVIGFYLEGTGTLGVNWGDGNTNNYTLTGSPQAVKHTFGAAGKYGVALIGNVTYLESNSEAGIGGAGCTSFGGNISTMTGLTYLCVYGSNTLSGSVTHLTGLTYLVVQGSNTLSGSITNLSGLTSLNVQGNSTLSGDITNLTGLTQLTDFATNTLSGSITNLTALTYLGVFGSNTLSGSVNNLTALTVLSVCGSNTLSGSVAGLTNLTFLQITGSNTVTGWETAAATCTGLCEFVQRGNTVLNSSQVNAVLAGIRANCAASHTAFNGLRTIDLKNTGNGPPTGQGITDKAYLQGYATPPGSTTWTVNTN